MITIGLLTSSRADFGIYEPLLDEMRKAEGIQLELIVFGTHLSRHHGHTIDYIRNQGYEVTHTLDTMPAGDSAEAIASSMGHTMTRFAGFWAANHHRYCYVICLGDRYEMFAAVLSALPYNVSMVHLHGGETTLGAIDNVFRHAISHASQLHFTSTQNNAERLKQMLEPGAPIFSVGSLSLDHLLKKTWLDTPAFKEKFGIDLSIPTALCTLHPETVAAEANLEYAVIFCQVIRQRTDLQFLITLPNADTAGNEIRALFEQQLLPLKHVCMVENLGTLGYFSAMKHCSFLMGNTSSGITEAASFGKWVINLGNRQKGREHSENLITLPFDTKAILEQIEIILENPLYDGPNIYHQPKVANQIMEHLKNHFA